MVIGFCLEDFRLTRFIAHSVGHTAGVHHASELHASETCSKHLGKHQFVEGIAVGIDIDFFGSPYSEGKKLMNIKMVSMLVVVNIIIKKS